MNPKRTTPRHILIKIAKVKEKERNLNSDREKQLIMYKGIQKFYKLDGFDIFIIFKLFHNYTLPCW